MKTWRLVIIIAVLMTMWSTQIEESGENDEAQRADEGQLHVDVGVRVARVELETRS